MGKPSGAGGAERKERGMQAWMEEWRERGSPLISGRSEAPKKKRQRAAKKTANKACTQFPIVANECERERRTEGGRQEEKEKSSRLNETEMEREDDRVREEKRRREGG